MSVMDFPRIHFNGEFSTNVCTANNDDVNLLVYNPVNVTLYDPPGGLPDADARTWLQQLETNGNYVRSGWNYYGDYTVSFNRTNVSQVTTDVGQNSPADPLIGQPVSLYSDAGTPPVMVDVDPTGTSGTQIFSNGFQVGNSTLGILAQAPSDCYTRWIGLKNISEQGFTAYAATWQFGVANTAITFYGADKSPALAALRAESAAGQGLLIQFCTYLLQPQISAADLAAKFAQGIPQTNPAVGRLVGTIGVWRPGEWSTAPNGRRLVWDSATSQYSPAAAQHDPVRKLVTLNLITTFPEQQSTSSGESPSANPQAVSAPSLQRAEYTASDPDTIEKVDFGDVTLAVLPSGGGQPLPIGPLTGYSDYQQYVLTAGMIDVTYTDDTLTEIIENGTLILTSSESNQPNPLLTEQTLVVDTDDRALYLEPGQSRVAVLQALERGRVPDTAVTLQLTIQPSDPHQQFAPTGKEITWPASVTTDGNGSAELHIQGVDAGLMLLQWLADGQPHSAADFTNVRVLPLDDFSQVKDEDLTWEFVYQNALRVYWVVFPAMQRLIDLSDEQSVVGAGEVILERLSDSLRESVLFMPITRSMSSGRRDLITRFLKLKLGIN